MANLQKFPAKICLTSAGILIHQEKILLVKHKKVGFWLNPGGHIEENEPPHKAAEREFWEETNINVRALPFGLMAESSATEYLPSPIATNLHWVCKENYECRMQNAESRMQNAKLLANSNYSVKKSTADIWPKGCEQHLNFLYLVEPVDVKKLDYKENVEETDGIAWFTLDEVKKLDTPDQIKNEVEYAFHVSKNLKPLRQR